MGLFNLFKKKETVTTEKEIQDTNKSVIPEEEKKFYQPEEYYVDVVNEGTIFEHRVVTFEERKKTAIPSERGLYPAEILLLDYCSKSKYPNPTHGYPGFWWFNYGIRDVGAALKKLEQQGYIQFDSISNSISNFTVAELKEILKEHGQSTTGEKAELVERVSSTVPEVDIINVGVQVKYILTELGRVELQENEYVPYMHSSPDKTIEGGAFGMEFNVWSINKLLGHGDKTNWKEVIVEQERRKNQEIKA